jgi:hypothetical protein
MVTCASLIYAEFASVNWLITAICRVLPDQAGNSGEFKEIILIYNFLIIIL